VRAQHGGAALGSKLVCAARRAARARRSRRSTTDPTRDAAALR